MSNENICMGCMGDKGTNEVCPICGFVEGTPPESTQHLPPRTILYGHYLIGRVLGHGGFGITYLAWDMNLNIRVAIKEYLPKDIAGRIGEKSTVTAYSRDLKQDFDYGIKKFLEEARMLARFAEHPNIVAVRDFFSENGTAYFVMSYVDGITFKQYIKQSGDKIEVDAALAIMMPVMDALNELHEQGMLHRDVSPDNIYITKTRQVKLLDFGAARSSFSEHSRSLSVILKPGYSPEEQYRTNGKQGPWSDVYSVGATIYRAITGVVPSESMDRLEEDTLMPPSALGIEIDPRIEAAIMKALSVRARDRLQSIKELQSIFLDDSDKKPLTDASDSVQISTVQVDAAKADITEPSAPEADINRPITSNSEIEQPISEPHIKEAEAEAVSEPKVIKKRIPVIPIATGAIILLIAIITAASVKLLSSGNKPVTLNLDNVIKEEQLNTEPEKGAASSSLTTSANSKGNSVESKPAPTAETSAPQAPAAAVPPASPPPASIPAAPSQTVPPAAPPASSNPAPKPPDPKPAETNSNASNTNSEDAAILSVMSDGFKALNQEDIYLYMEVLDENASGYYDLIVQTKKMFEIYDLQLTADDLKVVSKTEAEAKVSYTQTTKKISGPDFQNTRAKCIDYLRKVNGQWKVYKTEVLSSENI